MADDDDEGSFSGLYENGHWVWDDNTGALLFVSDLPPKRTETVQILIKAPTGAIEFRDDVDLIEQVRFRRRYQRKLAPGDADVITLQDVKDLVIYTAPVNILSTMLINLLHLPTTDRFLRALILCSAYYLQVADDMANRMLELDTKVRTPDCEIMENEFRENLSDLRLLVAKEYCVMLIGGGETKNYHHMGPSKKRQSLSDKDARLFETLLRMSIQIVWLALGRKNFHQIELETNRLFKSEIFNVVEHNLKTEYISKMAPEERAVLLGRCVRHDKKLTTHSPLMDEVFCDRDIGCRLMGLGVIKFTEMTRRLNYLRQAVAAKEDQLKDSNVSLGIIGLPRSKFDTMLRPIPQAIEKSKASVSRSSAAGSGSANKRSNENRSSSMRKSTMVPFRLYPEIRLPPKDTRETSLYVPPSFPEELDTIMPVNDIQRRRWLNRLQRLIAK